MIMRGEYEGWTRRTMPGTDLEAYYTERWGRGFWVDASLVDMLPEEKAWVFLRAELAKMAGTGPATA